MTGSVDNKPAAVFPIVPAMLTLWLACVAVAVVVTGVAYATGHAEHARLSAIAALVCGGAGLMGMLPVWAMSRHSLHGAAYGFLVGILFRMLAAGGVVLAAQWWWKWDNATALALWVVGWYLLVLVIEVKLVAGYVMQLGKRPGTLAHGKVVEV